jgi:hypothetical protein
MPTSWNMQHTCEFHNSQMQAVSMQRPFVPLPHPLLHMPCISRDHQPCDIARVPTRIMEESEFSPFVLRTSTTNDMPHVKGRLTFFENSEPINRFRRQALQSKFPAHLSVTTGVDMVMRPSHCLSCLFSFVGTTTKPVTD